MPPRVAGFAARADAFTRPFALERALAFEAPPRPAGAMVVHDSLICHPTHMGTVQSFDKASVAYGHGPAWATGLSNLYPWLYGWRENSLPDCSKLVIPLPDLR